MPELTDVVIRAPPDTDPNFDHLGEYSDTPGPEGRTIDRQERGESVSRASRYFIAADAEHAEECYERMRQFSKARVSMNGIRAEAKILVNGVAQTVRSGGLYGIASDSDSDYAREVAHDELSALADILGELGVIEEGGTLEAKFDRHAPWNGKAEVTY